MCILLLEKLYTSHIYLWLSSLALSVSKNHNTKETKELPKASIKNDGPAAALSLHGRITPAHKPAHSTITNWENLCNFRNVRKSYSTITNWENMINSNRDILIIKLRSFWLREIFDGDTWIWLTQPSNWEIFDWEPSNCEILVIQLRNPWLRDLNLTDPTIKLRNLWQRDLNLTDPTTQLRNLLPRYST